MRKLSWKLESQTKQMSKLQRKVEKLAAENLAVKAENMGMKELVGSTKKQLEDEKSKSLCVICYEQERDTILLPCKMYFNLEVIP